MINNKLKEKLDEIIKTSTIGNSYEVEGVRLRVYGYLKRNSTKVFSITQINLIKVSIKEMKYSKRKTYAKR